MQPSAHHIIAPCQDHAGMIASQQCSSLTITDWRHLAMSEQGHSMPINMFQLTWCSCAYVGPTSKPKSGRHRSALQHWLNVDLTIGPTSLTLDWCGANIQPTFSQHWGDIGPMFGLHWADTYLSTTWQHFGRLFTNFFPTFYQHLVADMLI